MSNRRLVINMIATIFSFIVTMGINFILSPFIINTVGKEAYGFVGLANNFISYAQLVTLALNAMAGRFITIKIHQNDIEEANKYFTSVVIVNTLTAITLFIPAVIIILNLDQIINVPQEILNDVQILWGLVFLNFLIGLILTTFNVATFVTNRLDLSSIRDIQSNVLRVIILIVSFSFFKPSVWYVGFASILCTIFVGGYNAYYKVKLLPDIKIRMKYFDIKVIIELLYSGIWHVIIKLGQILSDGLDLLISNIFINPAAMGILAIAKTVPNAIFSLLCTISGVFSPQITIQYAKGNKRLLTDEIVKSMKFTGFFANIPLAFLISAGLMFYQLWVPTENTSFIQSLSILTVIGFFIQGVINPLFGIFTVTNKVKLHSCVIVLIGMLNTFFVLILLKTTDLGILAVAGVSSTTNILRDLLYTPLYSAYCLNIPIGTFYRPIIRYLISTIMMIITFSFLTQFISIVSWKTLILLAICCGIVGGLLNYVIMFEKKERDVFNNIILGGVKKVLTVR